MEVGLVLQVGDVELPDVVPQHDDGHDQRQEFLAVFLDHAGQFPPGLGVEPVRDIARHVLQHVRVVPPGGRTFHDPIEFVQVGVRQFGGGGIALRFREQPSEAPRALLAVGHEEILVGPVIAHQRLPGQARGGQLQPAVTGKNPADEIFPDPGIVQPLLFYHRQVGEGFHQPPGEYPAPVPKGGALELDDGYPFHAAGGRTALHDVSAQFCLLQGLHALPGEPVHHVGVIDAGLRQHPDVAVDPGQLHGLPRSTHARFHFRADGDPLHVTADHVHQVIVALVPAVVADPLAEQAGGDADAHRQFGPVDIHQGFVAPGRTAEYCFTHDSSVMPGSLRFSSRAHR